MRCEKCGAMLGNKIIRVNGVVLCENCAREFGVGDAFKGGSFMGGAFPLLDGLTEAIMGTGGDLEFANTKLRCPRCGSSLRDLESTGKVGCIECYNVFSDIIAKKLLRTQGSTEYLGRTPGKAASGIDVKPEEPDPQTDSKEEKKPVTEVKAEEKKNDKALTLDKIRKADLGMVPDDDLEEAMKTAAEAEDYVLAAKIRDEIRSRKGGN